MTTKKPAPAGTERRFALAAEAFGKAAKELGKRDFAKAQELFDRVIEDHAEETAIVDRARTYRRICVKELDDSSEAVPKGYESILARGVVTHNLGEYDKALTLFQKAVEEQPGSQDAFYCLAAAAAQVGDTGLALSSLGKCIEIGPGNRAQARADSDFDGLRETEEFIDLVYS